MSVSGTELLGADIESVKQQIEDGLDRYTRLSSGCPDHLRQAMRYSLLSDGKRLRPLLVMAAARAVGGEPQNAIPSALKSAPEQTQNRSTLILMENSVVGSALTTRC